MKGGQTRRPTIESCSFVGSAKVEAPVAANRDLLTRLAK